MSKATELANALEDSPLTSGLGFSNQAASVMGLTKHFPKQRKEPDELFKALAEARRWIGDGELSDGLAREYWTPEYAALIDRVDRALNNNLAVEQRQEAWQPCAFDEIADASKNLAPWLSAALDDPLACDEFKKAVDWWFQSGADKIRELPKERQEAWRGLSDAEWMNIVNKNQAWFGVRPEEVAHEVCKLIEEKLREKNAKPAEQQEATCKQSLQVAAATKAGGDEPVASIYITPSGEREFDDWNCPLPAGRNVLYTRPQTQAEINSWSVLAARALDDAHRVLETIEPESSSEEDSISELSKRVQELFVQALVLHGFKTRKEMDAAKHFNRVAIDTAMLNAAQMKGKSE